MQIQIVAHKKGVSIHTYHDYLLVEPAMVVQRKVFTPFYHLWQHIDKPLPRANINTLPPFPASFVKRYDWLLTPEDQSVYERLGAKKQSYRSIEHAQSRFARLPYHAYTDERNRPDYDGTSCLSPYLRF